MSQKLKETAESTLRNCRVRVWRDSQDGKCSETAESESAPCVHLLSLGGVRGGQFHKVLPAADASLWDMGVWGSEGEDKVGHTSEEATPRYHLHHLGGAVIGKLEMGPAAWKNLSLWWDARGP